MTSTGGASPGVSVGIVTWNSEADLPTCLSALSAQTYTNLDLLVVDNASEDTSVDIARDHVTDARILVNEQNEGYCRAHNQAIELTDGKYYLALNPDVILGESYIELLVDSLERRSDFGGAMGKLRLPDEGRGMVLDGTGLFLDRSRHQYLRGHGELDDGQYDEPGEIFGADGAAPLFRRAMLQDIQVMGQVFDEEFFNYMEDVDLAWRARLLGWRTWYEPSAKAVHDRTFKPGVRRPMPRWLRRMAVKNRYLMLVKNEGKETWRRDWWRILFYDFQILGYVLLLEQTSLGAYPDFWSARKAARRWRREIWSRVTSTQGERLGWFG